VNLKDILDALNHGSSVNQGRITLFPEGRNYAKLSEIKFSSFYKPYLNEILLKSEQFLNEPITSLTYSTYKIFSKTGSRKEYEKEYFKRRARLNTFAILTMLFEDEKYIYELEDIIWAICEEFTWCLPAHAQDGGNSVTGLINPSPLADVKIEGKLRSYKETIDLFSAETGFALSEICSLLEDKLSPLVICRARNEVKERILKPFCELNSLFGWETNTSNWSAVCGGSVGAAAIYLVGDNSVLAPIVHRLIGIMDVFLSGYMDDGACTEGLGYWTYGFGFFIFFAELLKQRTDGKIDLANTDKVRNIALFQQKCYLSENKIISFSDSSSASNFSTGLTHHLKELFDEVQIPDIKYGKGFNDDRGYRWASNVRDLIWSNPKNTVSSLKTSSYYLEQSEWFISNYTRGSNIICLAAKGGHNDEPHNHNDVGNFLFHINGETLITDLGAGEYTRQYFGPERYSFFCNSSEGHSVPVIDGLFQKTGKGYKAEVLKADLGNDRDIFVLDISGAYDCDSLTSLIRNFHFSKGNSVTLTINDEFSFTSPPSSIVERFISFQKPQLVASGRVRLAGLKSFVDILFDSDKLTFSSEKHEFMTHSAEPADVYTVDLKCICPGLYTNIEITLIPNLFDN
jgi:hypothetical protein